MRGDIVVETRLKNLAFITFYFCFAIKREVAVPMWTMLSLFSVSSLCMAQALTILILSRNQ